MKKDGKYRFSLQFPADTGAHIRAGELLERLGNKKSAVVVAAVNEYLAAHPDLHSTGRKVKIEINPGYDRRDIEKLIHTIVEEKLAALGGADHPSIPPPTQEPEEIKAGIAQMLDNLDLFS